MKKKNFRVALLTAALVTVAGFSMQKKQDTYDQGHSAKEEQMSKGYNYPARYDVKGAWDYFITASFIYWQPKQKGTDVAIHEKSDLNFEDNQYSLVGVNNGFEPSFKVGLGLNSDYDNWGLSFEYTRLYTKNSGSKVVSSVSNISLYPIWTLNDNNLCLYSKGEWKIGLNLLDLELARPFYTGTKLIFNPHIGARFGLINQKYHARNESLARQIGLNEDAHAKSHSWLLGPRCGMDTSWCLGKGFRFFGNAAASIFYQKFDSKVDITNHPYQTDPAATYKYNDERGYINANVEAAVGFGWGCYFSDDGWHFDLLASYEFHHFLNQNMMQRLLESLDERTDAKASDLSLNGLTITARLDF